MYSRNILLLILGLLLGIALTLSVGFLARPYTYRGSLIDPPIQAADFELTNQEGQPFRLSELRGKVVVLFFGYTNCPDVCPVTLTEFKRLRANLGERADQVSFVYITVDPERDTPERMKAQVADYDPAIHALTGAREELLPVWKAFGIYQEKVEADTAADYLVDHTSRVYVIDAGGNWRLTFPFGMETKAMLDDIRQVLKGK
jgi:protein SCO1/2